MTSLQGRILAGKALGRGNNRTYDAQFLQTAIWISLCIVGALVIGVLAGTAQWPYLIAIAAIPFVVWWPVQTTLGMFALALPFDFVPLAGGETGMTLPFLLGAAAIPILLVEGYVTRRLEMPSRSALWWLLFVTWGTVTVAWAMDPEATIHHLPTAWATMLLYLVAVSFRFTKKEFYAIATMALMGGCIAAAYAAVGFHRGSAFQSHERASLVVGSYSMDPNYFAASLLLPLSLAIGGLLFSRFWSKRLCFLAAILVVSYALLLSMSRGALIAVLVMVLVYFLRLRVKKALLIIVSVFVVAPLAMPEKFFSRLQQAGAGGDRLNIWFVGWEAAKHYGTIGAGLSNFPIIYDKYMGAATLFQGSGFRAHNIYVEMLVELGSVGLLLFALASLSQLREAKASRVAVSRASTELSHFLVVCEATCLSMLVSSFFLGLLWAKTFWLAWMMLAMVVKLARSAEADSQFAA